MVTFDDFKQLIPDPTGSKCAAFSKVLLRLPSLLYQWMKQSSDANGRALGAHAIGDIIWSAAPSAETADRLLANGQEVSKTTFVNLYAAIGDAFGSAGSPSNFKLPDLRARFPIGVGSTAKPIAIALGATGGEDEHLLLTAEMPAHRHNIITTGAGKAGDSFRNPANPDPYSGSYPTNADQQTESVGSDTAHNNMPPYFGLYAYIQAN